MARDIRRTARQAASQGRSQYLEPDTDDDFEMEDAHAPSPIAERAPPTKRQRRSNTGRRSVYTEPNTDDEFEASDESFQHPSATRGSETANRSRRVASASRTPARAQRRNRAQNRTRTSTTRGIQPLGQPRRANSQAVQEQKSRAFQGPSDNRIPPWASLPVDILKDIFVYSVVRESKHLRSPEASADVSWLLKAALTCRAFTLPALEAYYESPVLLNTLQPHELVELLRHSDNSRYMNYNVKIKHLRIDVEILAHVAHNRPLFDLNTLVAQLPQLQDLEILSRKYLPPYRLDRARKWSLPMPAIVQTMTTRGIQLKSWRWSRDFVIKETPDELFTMMMTAHTSKPFQRLKRLTMTGFNCDGFTELMGISPSAMHDGATGNVSAPPLASVITMLPNLSDLTFISCDVVMDDFLQHLPSNLTRIELTNCLEITSDIMQKYLHTSGQQLRELVLSHDTSLNFSFLGCLGACCPRLETLKMDLTYYSERVASSDSGALYDELLLPGERPSWPSSLRHLELLHAQKWSSDAAESLFDSLVSSAQALPNLRYLIIHAHIDIPWRDRVGFRDQWTKRLRRVFLRPRRDPSQNMGSLRQYRLWKQAQDSLTNSSMKRNIMAASVQANKMDEGSTASNTKPRDEGTEPRRSQRVAETRASQPSMSEDSAVESTSPGDSDDEAQQPNDLYIQGLCHKVDISIDNQRPREVLWTERDFLDSEKSGDEDWSEGADDVDN